MTIMEFSRVYKLLQDHNPYMASDCDRLEELIDPPRITDKSVGYITSILSTSPSSGLEYIDEEGKVTLRFSGDIELRISGDKNPPIVWLDTTQDGVLLRFDLTSTV